MTTSATQNVLTLKDITMQFGGVVAVDNFSCHVDRGEIVSFIGPNGAGKTTVFNAITGVYQPTNGIVEFMGQTIASSHPKTTKKNPYLGQNIDKYSGQAEVSLTPDKIARLGMARTFQNIRLWKSQSVFNNVLTAKHMKRTSNVFSAAFRLNRAEEESQKTEVMRLLELVELSDLANEKAVSLPYGKQRRLEIARALATEPQLLLLDEPAAGMNPQETLELAEFIKRIRAEFKITVLLIEHHMDLVMKISDRIYVLEFGKCIAEGRPKEIQNNKKVIDAYLGSGEDA